MNNTLIDNSENLKMADTLKKCISNDNCKVIKIATGYWDIPGFMLVGEELRRFLEKDGRELQLLIGTDPIVRAYQQESVRMGRFPEDYIKTDINDLKLKKEYMGRRGKISEKSSGRISIRRAYSKYQKWCWKNSCRTRLCISTYSTMPPFAC